MTDEKQIPAYRQFWVWFVFAIPLIGVVVASYSGYLAIHNGDTEVVKEAYTEGSAINNELRRENKARQLGLHLTLDVANGNQLTLSLHGSQPLKKDALQMTLSHPTDAKQDLSPVLKVAGDGLWKTELPADLKGRRYLLLQTDEWKWVQTVEFPLTHLELAAQ